jgi:hypothetical protein
MKDGNRAKRRGHQLRMKSRAKRVMRRWMGNRLQTINPRDLGVNTSTHCRPCACWMCQEQRKEIPPPRERAFEHIEHEQE